VQSAKLPSVGKDKRTCHLVVLEVATPPLEAEGKAAPMGGLYSLFSHELTIPERLPFLYAFVALGLVIAVQFSQLLEKEPIRWTKLTPESR
jgi:hypothetical protein